MICACLLKHDRRLFSSTRTQINQQKKKKASVTLLKQLGCSPWLMNNLVVNVMGSGATSGVFPLELVFFHLN